MAKSLPKLFVTTTKLNFPITGDTLLLSADHPNNGHKHKHLACLNSALQVTGVTYFASHRCMCALYTDLENNKHNHRYRKKYRLVIQVVLD